MRLSAAAGRAGLAFAAILLTLLALEGLLRATSLSNAAPSPAVADDRIAWRYRPGAMLWSFSENDHPVGSRINSTGWRDVERSPEKPDGVYRVAVLGDSFVEAASVELDSTFTRLAETALNERSGDLLYELLNFGRSGFSQSEELLVLEDEVLEYQPDVLLLFFYPINDVTDIGPATATDPLRPFHTVSPDGTLEVDLSFAGSRSYRVKRAIGPIKSRSVLLSLLTGRYNAMRATARRRSVSSAPVDEVNLSGVRTLATAEPDSTYLKNYALNRLLIRRIAALAADRGVKFVLVTLPLSYYTEEVRRFQSADATFDPDFFDRDLAQLAAEIGAEHLGLQGPFNEVYGETGESLNWGDWEEWGHWNYAGHRLVADLVQRTILKMQQAGGDTPN